jgi:nucleotide-binding universal stress UspA family protein
VTTTAPDAAQYSSVLVPLDGSELAEPALQPGGDLARRFGADVHVLIAGVHDAEAWWCHRYLDRVAARLPEVTLHTDNCDAADAIMATARSLGRCLVCLSTHGLARSAAVTGSTFAAVSARIGRPLVAVGPRLRQSAGDAGARIVVCLDGRPAAESVVPTAAAWARRFGLRVTLVTAADPVLVRSRLARDRAAAVWPPGRHGDPESYLRAVGAGPELDGLEVDTRVLWGLGNPNIVIGEHLDRHPAVVVAATTHARTGLARAVLGSEVARIVHRSPVPVLVQPPLGG